MRSLLGLKLFGDARHSHIMSHVFDEEAGQKVPWPQNCAEFP